MYLRTEVTDWPSTFDWSDDPLIFGYMQPGYQVTGTVGGSDTGDMIMVPLPALQTVHFTIEGDGVTAVLRDDMESWAFVDGELTHETFHPSTWYFVEVTGSGAYTITMDGLPSDYAPDEEDSTNDVIDYVWMGNTGMVFTGVINGNDTVQDEDTYAAYLAGGITYRWEVESLASDFGTTAGAWLTIYDDAGTEVTGVSYSFSAWGDTPNWIEFTPDTTGTYVLGVTTYADFNDSGSYGVTFDYADRSGDPVQTIPEIGISNVALVENGDTWEAHVTVTLTGDDDTRAISGQIGMYAHDPAAQKDRSFHSFEIAGDASQTTVVVSLGDGTAFATATTLVFNLTGMTDVSLSNDQSFASLSLDSLVLGGDTVSGSEGADTLDGTSRDDSLTGLDGNDLLRGDAGNDTLRAGDGNDTLIGGDGDDFLFGGDTEADLRDLIYGGEGNDSLDGGYGNDELRGDGGNDTITGGFGVDDIFGGEGNDVLTGQAWSDLIFGGNGDDFINGGFGYDRVNGGAGADRFFHLGVADHGSDWIQDYTAADGDVLQYGAAGTADQFQVNFTETANAGTAGVEEAFVIYRPTGQILWALVDGAAQSEINLLMGGVTYDLLSA